LLDAPYRCSQCGARFAAQLHWQNLPARHFARIRRVRIARLAF